MTLDVTAYTVGSNEPLDRARILWDMLDGSVTADGTNGDLAANDYTAQRWALASGANDWTLALAAAQDVDTVFISAHNLSGRTIRAQVRGDEFTNSLTYSEQLDNADWNKTRASVTANNAVAPDGLTTADLLAEDTSNNTHQVEQAFTAAGSTTYTFSVFIKAAGRGFAQIEIGNFSNQVAPNQVDVNLTTGAFDATDETRTVVETLPNGWFRVATTVTTIPAGGSIVPRIRIASALGVASYLGDGASGILLWGAQLVEGAEPQSYAKTEAAAVTTDWQDLSSWLTVPDNSTIAVMGNDASGDAFSTNGFRIRVSQGNGNVVGIIRAGKALQMQRPFFGGYSPIRLNRVTEGQQSFSETGQWLGRTERRIALTASYDWQHLKADWYRANFEPFAKTLPLKPFGIIGNPLRMPEDVAWAWVSKDPRPSNMGIVDLMQVSLDVTGFWS